MNKLVQQASNCRKSTTETTLAFFMNKKENLSKLKEIIIDTPPNFVYRFFLFFYLGLHACFNVRLTHQLVESSSCQVYKSGCWLGDEKAKRGRDMDA
jgi:hypothetical protein